MPLFSLIVPCYRSTGQSSGYKSISSSFPSFKTYAQSGILCKIPSQQKRSRISQTSIFGIREQTNHKTSFLWTHLLNFPWALLKSQLGTKNLMVYLYIYHQHQQQKTWSECRHKCNGAGGFNNENHVYG